ncbi:hypothetical protein PsorP6_011605 [Peronosclerospora sorghi]|uniref:Uncharacterized protein n=1 Tax=Peronosclerospora sorghi TaxID=230839 RepID=A0ACC0WII0_9STRA|nr:hypothetical protein PsorP6_011605 [Peronosclerospora sorghi]
MDYVEALLLRKAVGSKVRIRHHVFEIKMNNLLKDNKEVKDLAELASYYLFLIWFTPKSWLNIGYQLSEVSIRHQVFEIKMNKLLKGN